MKCIGIIPARYAATRLPGKPLADISGRPMIQHVYERALQAHGLRDVIVATDDERIRDAVMRFGGRVVMTSSDHHSGTDRLAEVAAGLDVDLVVNIQGDEPLIEPGEIDLLISPFRRRRALGMATLCTPIALDEDFEDPAVVKVVRDLSGFALYFSRSAIPYRRAGSGVERLKHIGMYAYRRSTLLRFAALPPTPLEQAEGLEQLRAVEHGLPIMVLRTEHDSLSVDTEADLERVRRIVAGRWIRQPAGTSAYGDDEIQ